MFSYSLTYPIGYSDKTDHGQNIKYKKKEENVNKKKEKKTLNHNTDKIIIINNLVYSGQWCNLHCRPRVSKQAKK